jgi:hypothetical protein
VKKIPNIFKRGEDGLLTDEVNPLCKWVFNGEGIPTIKWDGTCVMIEGDGYFKRRTVTDAQAQKNGWPEGFRRCESDPLTGKTFGWVPVGDGPEDKQFHQGLEWLRQHHGLKDGTYELIGPKVQGNPHGKTEHQLVKHGVDSIHIPWERNFADLRSFFLCQMENGAYLEGIVFHHPDGRMAKIKARDFIR